MTPDDLASWLAGLPPALFLRESALGYLLVNAAHIAALGVLIGAITALDLRLLRSRATPPLREAGPYLSHLAAGGLAGAALTGLLLFSVKPDEYLGNRAFLIKLAVIAAGILNALWVHAGPHWRAALQGAGVPRRLRAHAAASLALWLGAVVAGRWIGFL
ncbi:DUF2214 domain-containing protein [Bordetella genomosp. 9]|uniref:DUF2214 domain-containing protein n=1 Tax=Bordetella genomosp. 9 TaxID=1416803 RepID=A0A261R6Q7_9BORD|nr:DUF2214 domain-containing protein [Bordetella genomosp. 9]OZI20661.1 DUF2214 domain-containing protein [Bordetella genomosp. 9]